MHKFIQEVQMKGNLSLADDLIHEEFYDHSLDATASHGREPARKLLQALHAKFSNITVEIIHCVSSGDIVATNKVLRATQTGGELRIEKQIMDFVRFEDGKFREHWANVRS